MLLRSSHILDRVLLHILPKTAMLSTEIIFIFNRTFTLPTIGAQLHIITYFCSLLAICNNSLRYGLRIRFKFGFIVLNSLSALGIMKPSSALVLISCLFQLGDCYWRRRYHACKFSQLRFIVSFADCYEKLSWRVTGFTLMAVTI